MINDIINTLKKYDLFISCDDFDGKISYLSYDSRDIKENTLFVCKGVSFKKEYLLDNISLGIVLYMSEVKYDTNVPCLLVSDIRCAMSIVSSLLYPDNLFKIGITGTKGKTTTNYFLNSILSCYLGYKPGFIATHVLYDGKSSLEHDLTTPESADLHKAFNVMTCNNLKYVSMEVSSGAMDQKRVFGVNFDIGAFLNIGEDHISEKEHKNFEEYFSCKLAFLDLCDTVVINKETDYLDRVIDRVKDKKIITFGYSDADFVISNINTSNGISFDLCFNGKIENYTIGMIGRFNVLNAVCAIIIAKLIGADYDSIKEGLLKTSVPGRMNVITGGVCPIIIDYAHNDLSARALYLSLKEDYPNKNIKVLFGCTGDRGINRRREMGLLAGEFASFIYLTEDDPEHSTVKDISLEIASYIEKFHHNYEIIEDRKQAILKAISELTSDDVLVLLGKGDETYQRRGNENVPYEGDKQIVLDILSKM